jgi:hypothetical protein
VGVSADVLTVGLFDDRRTLHPGDSLTFGRRADLMVDENPFMHRVVGRFTHREGVWWMQNHGSTLRVELHDVESGAQSVAPPGHQLPVTASVFTVRFTAGPTNYELEGDRDGPDLIVDEAGDVLGTATIEFGSVPLSPEQHLLLVALYESSDRNNGAIESSAVIARRLGWTPKKFHRKLDAVCEKLDRQGVRDLKAGDGSLADTRRSVLVRHALNAGLISNGDLGLLHAAPAPPEESAE